MVERNRRHGAAGQRQLGASARARRSRRLAWALGLACMALHPTARALAEEMVGALARPAPAALTTPRDPREFLAGLAVVLPRPGVLLTRQDAVALELQAFSPTMSLADTLRTAQTLCDEASAAGYDPLMFLAVMRVESRYDHLAISNVGAEGLMQLMPPTAQWMAHRLHLSWDETHRWDFHPPDWDKFPLLGLISRYASY